MIIVILRWNVAGGGDVMKAMGCRRPTRRAGSRVLDIAVFPTAEQAGEYGRQAGYPYAVGDGWVIITESQALAEQIADVLHGAAG